MFILMQGATRENQHVEVWYLVIISNNTNMLTFLTLELHMILYKAGAAACIIEAVDEEEETEIFVLYHPLYARRAFYADNVSVTNVIVWIILFPSSKKVIISVPFSLPLLHMCTTIALRQS